MSAWWQITAVWRGPGPGICQCAVRGSRPGLSVLLLFLLRLQAIALWWLKLRSSRWHFLFKSQCCHWHFRALGGGATVMMARSVLAVSIVTWWQSSHQYDDGINISSTNQRWRTSRHLRGNVILWFPARHHLYPSHKWQELLFRHFRKF